MKLIQRIAGLMMALWLASYPVMSSAALSSAESAFSGLVSSANISVDSPGYLNSATRNVFVGGSMHMWVPRQTVQLISISPPSFSAGCGGIDFFLGGFSFINAAQFQALIKNIMQAALGYAIQLGIRTLCPMCADILATLQKLAQKANQMGMDSCQMAQNLVNKGFEMAGLGSYGKDGTFSLNSSGGPANQTATNDSKDADATCSTLAAKAGDSDSFFGAMSSVCNGMSSALGKINQYLDSPFGGATKEGVAGMVSGVSLNPTWIGLTQAGYSSTAFKELVMSVSGFTVKPTYGSNVGKSINYPGWNTEALSGDSRANVLIALLLFGNDPQAGFTQFKNESGTNLSAQDLAQIQQTVTHIENLQLDGLPMYVCGTKNAQADDQVTYGSNHVPPITSVTGSGDSNVLSECQYAGHENIGNTHNPLIAGQGIYFNVYKTLNAAVKAVATDSPMPQDAINLMQITPLPVYKMVNIAAVYPGAAAQLVDTYSYLIATLIVQSLVSNWSMPEAQGLGQQGVGNGDLMKMANSIVTAVAKSTQSAAGSIGVALREQQAIMASIKAINSTIYQKLSATGLQGNMLFSQQVIPH